MVTHMREKGQVTIPAGIRESLGLSRDSLLSVSKVGGAILLTPKPSVYEAVSTKFTKAAREKKVTLNDLLKDLKRIRGKKP